jgi:hypothetical protein
MYCVVEYNPRAQMILTEENRAGYNVKNIIVL